MDMKSTVPNTLLFFLACFFLLVNAPEPMAQQKPAAKPVTEIRIGYLRAYEPQLALSVLDIPPEDEGVAGANVADMIASEGVDRRRSTACPFRRELSSHRNRRRSGSRSPGCRPAKGIPNRTSRRGCP